MKNTIRAAFVVLSLATALMGCQGAPDEPPTPERTTTVSEALVNNGGSSGLNWWCSEDGSCTCEGGTPSSDCWGLSEWCIDAFQCPHLPPCLCYCDWKVVRQEPVIKTTTATVGTMKAISQ
jgi:hypothetical protein